MTVKLLVDWTDYRDGKQYKVGNLVTTDAGTETGLVNSKQADSNLTGGTSYVPPVVETQCFPVMGSVNPLTGGNAILRLADKNIISLMYADVTASKTLALADAGQVLKCNSASAIVLTIPDDATGLWEGNDGIAAYQAGAGAVSFAAGSSVTLRGTAPTSAQYSTQGVMRVGQNEWAYL